MQTCVKLPSLGAQCRAGTSGQLSATTPGRHSFPAALWLAPGEQAPAVFICITGTFIPASGGLGSRMEKRERQSVRVRRGAL